MTQGNKIKVAIIGVGNCASSLVQGVIKYRDAAADELLLLPAEAVNADGLFIDSMPLSDLTAALAPATVATGHEITECLKSLCAR